MKIRNLLKEEISILFECIKTENWDLEKAHTLALYASNPEGFFIAFKEEEETLGFIVAIKESDCFGSISTFLVLKKFRRQGYGKQLFLHAKEHLSGCQIALESQESQVPMYEKFGFKAYFPITNYFFTLTSHTLTSMQLPLTTDFTLLTKKDTYLNSLLNDPTVEFVAIKNDKLDEYAFMFPYKEGFKVHINSKSSKTTLALLYKTTLTLPLNTKIYIQMTPLLPLLEQLIIKLSMKETSKFIRMYNKILD